MARRSRGRRLQSRHALLKQQRFVSGILHSANEKAQVEENKQQHGKVRQSCGTYNVTAAPHARTPPIPLRAGLHCDNKKALHDVPVQWPPLAPRRA